MASLRRALAVVLTVVLLATVGVPAGAAELREGTFPLTDVAGTQYERSVELLWRLKVVSGVSETAYGPEELVTRAQMAVFLIRALGRADQAAALADAPSFADVPASHWAAGYIVDASDIGLIQGSDGRFRPEDTVTYAEAATMLVRASGHEPLVVGQWPEGHLAKARELRLLEGISFAADAPVPRGELALMLSALVFQAPNPATNQTLNQSVFQLADRIEILPDAKVMASGEVRVSARVLDPAGRELPTVPALREETGQLKLERGVLTVPAGVESVILKAAAGELLATRTYTVGKATVTVEPRVAVVPPGGQVTLTATATAGAAPGAAAPVWSVTSGVATVDAAGVVQVPTGTTGVSVIAARIGDLTGTAQVYAADHLEMAPAQPVVAAGGSLTLTARIPGAPAGAPLPAVTWTAANGQIGADGRYQAPATGGTDTVTAMAGPVQGQVKVQIATALELSPSSFVGNSGASTPFTAVAVVGDQRVPVTPESWSVEGSVGSVDAQGSFTAGGAGQGFVVARYGELSARVPVTVSGSAASLQVVVTPVQLRADGTSTARVQARLLDAAGTLVARDGVAVAFSVADGSLATLPTALAETQAGVAEVELVAGNRSGTTSVQALAVGTGLPVAKAAVTLAAPQPARLRLVAEPTQLAAGQAGQSTITSTLLDHAGEPIANTGVAPLTFTLTTDSTTATLASTALVIPVAARSAATSLTVSGTAGAVAVSGSGPLPVDGVSVTVKPAGPASQLQVQPDRASAPADGVTAITVQVAVADAAGVVRTSEEGTPIFLTIRGPGGGAQTVSQLTSAGIARFQIRQARTGEYELTATSGSGSLPPGQATVSFTTADSSGTGSTGTGGAGTGSSGTGDTGTGSSGTGSSGTGTGNTGTGGTGTGSGTSGTGAAVPQVGVSQPEYKVGVVLGQSSFSTGQPLSVQVRILTPSGDLATWDGDRTVSLLASGEGVVINPPSQVVKGGQATFTVTGLTPGEYHLTGTAVNVGNPMASTRITFTGQNLAAKAERLEIVTPGSPLAVGAAATVQVALRTTTGQLATTDPRPVTLTTVTPGITISQGTVTPAAGLATFTVTAVQGGIAQFTALAGGDIASATGTVAFGPNLAGQPVSLGFSGLQSSYTIGTAAEVRVEVRDPYGQAVGADYGRPVQLTIYGANGIVTPAVTNTQGGVATFRVSPSVGGGASLVAVSSGLSAATAPVVFGVQTPRRLQIQLDPTVTYKTGAPLAFQVAVVGESGAVVTSDTGRNITLAASSGVTVTIPAAFSSQGYATFTVTSPGSGTKSILAVSEGLEPGTMALTFSPTGTNPTVSMPTSLAFNLAQTANLPVGAPVGFQVVVKDQLGQLLTDENFRRILVAVTGPATVSPAETTTWGGVGTFTVRPTAAGTIVMTATSNGLPAVQVTVTAGQVATSGGGSQITSPYRIQIRAQSQVRTGGQLLITAVLVDQAGAPLDTPRVPVTLSLASGSGTLSAATVTTPGSVIFTGSAPGTVTVTGTASGYTVAPASINVTAQ